jgi:hypothetical protein
MNCCSNCNLPLPGAGPVRTCPRCFTVTNEADIDPVDGFAESDPEIEVSEEDDDA